MHITAYFVFILVLLTSVVQCPGGGGGRGGGGEGRGGGGGFSHVFDRTGYMNVRHGIWCANLVRHSN
ncbi:unnamed protein product [Rotaria sordida]|uniref:Uncharacterized protein n=2 Tax=Rotaria sordida TaxID=392033 RepID=A0A819P7Z6_9BILA|nr:unnamed protein product [Rotaria sordida]